MAFAAVPDEDVCIDTFTAKLRERVAVRGRIEKMPEPKLVTSIRWDRLGALLANVTAWVVILGVGSMMWVAL